ncbi:MAG: hypothetical protein U0904_12155 [Candidatus Nanopelagicales bacterium]|nr:hypothetical protein [Candidatus Nanopelagicales bacterium]
MAVTPTRGSKMRRRGFPVAIAGATGVAVAAVALVSPAQAIAPGAAMNPTVTASAASAGPTKGQLRKARNARVFFGHQSVGWNIIDGMNALYAARGLAAPNQFEGSAGLPAGGVFAHEGIGSNGDPTSKINDFAGKVRAGAGDDVQVAFMKLCYVDFGTGSHPKSVFKKYRRMIKALSSEYPGVAFLHVTAPLTTNDPASNVVRQKYNALIRRAYAGTGRLFDLAKVESTRPNGTRVLGHRGGKRYFALYGGYASDEGHLNAAGSRRASRAMLRVTATAT